MPDSILERLRGTYGCDILTTLALDAPVAGTLTPDDCALEDGSSADFYAFHLDEVADLQIDLTSNDFDAFVGLRGTDGDALTVDDNDSVGGAHARIARRLDAGVYIVIANAVSAGEGGTYTLRAGVRR